MKLLLPIILLLGVLGFLSTTTLIQSPTSGSLEENPPVSYRNTYIVIAAVGNYKYMTFRKGDLQYTVNDANKFYQFFINPLYGKVPGHQIVFLKNELATKEKILQALGSTFAKAGPEDRVIFYFSGHGAPSTILPFEAQGMDKNTHIDYDDIKAAFKNSQAKTKLCFIDACYANSVKQPKASRRKQTKKATSKAVADAEIAVMVSSQSYQTSGEYRALKQGVFSYFLLQGMEGRADRNRDKVISIAELHHYVYHNVKGYTQNKQLPHTFGRFSKRMPVVHLR